LAQAPTFNTLATTPTGSAPWNSPGSAAVGDFNGDGKLDAIISDGSQDLRLMLGNGAGTFTQQNIGVPGASAGMIKAADLNGDGKLDAVFVSPQGNLAPTVLLNTGNDANGVPQFTVTTYTPVYSGLRSVTVGDLNGDGKPDFIVGNAYGSLQAYLNNGNGTFTGLPFFNLVPNVGGSTGQGVIADVNGDGKADYVVTSNQAGATDVFFGNGNGTFQAPTVIPSSTTSLAAADVNGDGKLDLLAVANGSPNQLLVYLNTGSGSFSAPMSYSTGGTAWNGWTALATADMNGDGKLDVVVANSGNNNVAVLAGNGSGTFGAASLYAVGIHPLDVAVRDFNGDGKPDVATVDAGGYGGNTYDVLTNTTVFAPPLPTQTLSILGGSGNVGDVAANVEYYNPATGNWQPAYLANYAPYGHPVTHPWGNVAGTNHWINYKVDGASDPGASSTNTLWYLYRVRFTVPSDAQNAKMTFSIKADNRAQIAINSVSTGATIVGQANQLNADAVFSQSVHPGENTITINVGDEGGLNGFNFRIDLSVQSAQPLEIVTPAPADTTPPVINAPVSITKEATGPSGAVVTFTATAQDNVDGAVPVVASPSSGSVFPIATTIVGLAASDKAGNTASATFKVTVQDTTAPALTLPQNTTAEATSASGAVVSYSVATATDAVGVASLTYSQNSGTQFSLGATTVTVTAKDAANNTSTGAFTVTVKDTTPPTLSVPANITAEATSANGAAVTYPAATATDAVTASPAITYSAASGSTFALGTTTVNVAAKDTAGNTSTGSFTITVVDTTAPTITSLSTNAPTLWPPNHKMVGVTVTASASDLVGVTSLKIVNVTSSEPDNGLGDGDTPNDIQITGDLTVNLRAERSGAGNGRTYTITVEARDAAGNASTKAVRVSVPSNQGGK
jgi:hypothetical protein